MTATCVIRVAMRDDCTINRSPGIDEEIASRAVQALPSENHQVWTFA
jgi:hypothetical protein